MSKTIKTGEPQAGDTGDKGKGEGDSYLGDWKTKEEAEKGLTNMQKLLDGQGGELGSLRKQTDINQGIIADLQSRAGAVGAEGAPGAVQGEAGGVAVNDQIAELESELATVEQEMDGLDPVSTEKYQKTHNELSKKARGISNQIVRIESVGQAREEFGKALEQRDIESTHEAFYGENPDFNTPEMQAQIKEKLATDKTGMSDPLVAYREIQRDAVTAENADLKIQLEEAQKLANLAGGVAESGKVVTRNASGVQAKTTQPKLKGKELFEGALDVARKARGA